MVRCAPLAAFAETPRASRSPRSKIDPTHCHRSPVSTAQCQQSTSQCHVLSMRRATYVRHKLVLRLLDACLSISFNEVHEKLLPAVRSLVSVLVLQSMQQADLLLQQMQCTSAERTTQTLTGYPSALEQVPRDPAQRLQLSSDP